MRGGGAMGALRKYLQSREIPQIVHPGISTSGNSRRVGQQMVRGRKREEGAAGARRHLLVRAGRGQVQTRGRASSRAVVRFERSRAALVDLGELGDAPTRRAILRTVRRRIEHLRGYRSLVCKHTTPTVISGCSPMGIVSSSEGGSGAPTRRKVRGTGEAPPTSPSPSVERDSDDGGVRNTEEEC